MTTMSHNELVDYVLALEQRIIALEANLGIVSSNINNLGQKVDVSGQEQKEFNKLVTKNVKLYCCEPEV